MTHRSRQELPTHIVNAPQLAASYRLPTPPRRPHSTSNPILQRAAVLTDDAHHLIGPCPGPRSISSVTVTRALLKGEMTSSAIWPASQTSFMTTTSPLQRTQKILAREQIGAHAWL